MSETARIIVPLVVDVSIGDWGKGADGQLSLPYNLDGADTVVIYRCAAPEVRCKFQVKNAAAYGSEPVAGMAVRAIETLGISGELSILISERIHALRINTR